jgi:gamma-glutamyl hercynylcysteine S-oxide synthase
MAQQKNQPAPVQVDSDCPTTEQLYFDFNLYADTLAALMANKENATPLIMGIHGGWGSGKTTLMKAIKDRLDGEGHTDSRRFRRCKTIWYSAWKHGRQDQPLAAVVEAVFKGMAADGFFSLARAKIETATKRIDKSLVFQSISRLIAGADISEFFSEWTYREQLGYFDTFQKFYQDLIWIFLNWRFKLTGQEKPDDKKAALVIFVDDLDRCPQPGIVKLLEAIQLFLNRSGCVFVLAADAGNIEAALEQEYGAANACGHLQTIFQIGFHLPKIQSEQCRELVAQRRKEHPAINDLLPVLLPALGNNPRQLKRFFNEMNLLDGMVRNAGANIDLDQVLLWGVLSRCFTSLAFSLKDDPPMLDALQQQIALLVEKSGDAPIWQLTDEQLHEYGVPPAWHACLQTPHLADIVARMALSADQLAHLYRLAGAVCRR